MRLITVLTFLTTTLMAGPAWSDNALDLNKHAGKVVYVDFWASWCIPCRASFPFMQDMADKFGEKLVITAINVDTDKQDALEFLSDFNVSFEIIYDPDGEIAESYDIKGMPASYLYDGEGNLLGSHTGFLKQDIQGLEKAITSAISQL